MLTRWKHRGELINKENQHFHPPTPSPSVSTPRLCSSTALKLLLFLPPTSSASLSSNLIAPVFLFLHPSPPTPPYLPPPPLPALHHTRANASFFNLPPPRPGVRFCVASPRRAVGAEMRWITRNPIKRDRRIKVVSPPHPLHPPAEPASGPGTRTAAGTCC